uniref:Transmembrane protein n=1 Tax=Toxoplasma gondii (strain ATCC 50861 / VEG) TaxID=432359 RepID=A0A0F7UUC5_TOXGV|nr:TPA: hypothetical protein BN1205_053340 [Toxoplasma gondii VEG]
MHCLSLCGSAAPFRHFILFLLHLCLVVLFGYLTIPSSGRAPASAVRIPGSVAHQQAHGVLAEQRWPPTGEHGAKGLLSDRFMHLQAVSLSNTASDFATSDSLPESFFQYYVKPVSPHQTALKWLGISFLILMGVGLLATILSCLFSSAPYAKERRAHHH